MKQAVVDKKICIGCGTCVVICPEVFQLNPEGKAEVKLESIDERLKTKVQEAIDSCPVNAIKLQEQ